ncbi:MAG: hypothetical protein ACI9S6_003138 [Reinekea sp.]|jgi:hypothetical protein
MDPTIIKKGMANSGKEEAEEINRCITKLTGIELLIKRKYTKEDAMSENAIGTFTRNKTNSRIIGI